MKKNAGDNIKVIGSESLQFILLAAILFVFWIVLSGMMKAKFLIIGFFTSLIIAWLTGPLLRLPSLARKNEVYLAFDFPYLKFIKYLPWLLWEVVKANIDVVKLVLNPKMPIDPVIIKFKKPMANPLAHVILANSITLTPGTITMDLEEGVYYVHAISKEAAEALAPKEGEGEMPRRVAYIFSEQGTSGGKGANN